MSNFRLAEQPSRKESSLMHLTPESADCKKGFSLLVSEAAETVCRVD